VSHNNPNNEIGFSEENGHFYSETKIEMPGMSGVSLSLFATNKNYTKGSITRSTRVW